MLAINIITIHPSFVSGYASFGVIAAAQRHGSVTFSATNLRNYAVDAHGTVDGRPFGGGDGMVMRPDSLAASIQAVNNPYVILPSPSGRVLSQQDCQRLAKVEDKTLVFVCGRFSGVDQRFIDRYVDEELSLGDYVISGGELASLVMIDAIVRFCPGAMSDEMSPIHDSFGFGCAGLLEHPLYTKPVIFESEEVPSVLRSGNHLAIETWRKAQSLMRTQKLRPDLFKEDLLG